jgi:hypothetical protein
MTSLEKKLLLSILFVEIKVVEKVFKRNQQTIKMLYDEQDELVKQLGEKLDRIQVIAEKYDAELIQNEIDNDK